MTTTAHIDPRKIPISQITKFIFIGTGPYAANLPYQNEHGIQAVLDLRMIAKTTFPPGIQFKHVPFRDKEKPMLEQVEECFAFIDYAVKQKKRVLVHCASGINRSPAIVAGYIALYAPNHTLREATEFVKNKRRCASGSLTRPVLAGVREYVEMANLRIGVRRSQSLLPFPNVSNEILDVTNGIPDTAATQEHETGSPVMSESTAMVIHEPSPQLAILDQARQMLAKCRTLPEVKKIRDIAEAARTYARAAHLGRESQNYAAEIALLAACKAGEILKQLNKSEGGRPSEKTPLSVGGVSEYAQTLKDTQTPSSTARYWQKLAAIPEPVVQEYIATVREAGSGEITAAGLMREFVHQTRAAMAVKPILIPDGTYRVVYADPPWDYGNPIAEGYGPAENHYPTMKLDDLCEMPLPKIADNAVLFLWATAPFLVKAIKVVEAWGFEYKTHFVWDKVRHNFGHYSSVRHELLLVATRGSCLPDTKELVDSVQSIERTEHSRKPERFREIIDQMYPTGPRIELFARGALPKGWVGWGNQYQEGETEAAA